MTRVLVADDNRELVLLFATVLEDAGYEVVVASTGPAALAAAEQAPLDAAVLDVLLPGISGDVIGEQLRETNPQLPVLLITGESGAQFVGTSELPVLQKPFTGDELVRVLREVLGG